jgi:hypothetical protein
MVASVEAAKEGTSAAWKKQRRKVASTKAVGGGGVA